MDDEYDAEETLDFGEILLGLREEFRTFRGDTARVLAAIQASTDFLARQVRNLGLRTTTIESDVTELETGMTKLVSGTPPPMEYCDD